MAAHDYHFITTWEIPAPIGEIVDVLGDAADLPRWWPAVYLDVTVLEPGDHRGVGRVVSLVTKGWLPYILRWRFRVTDVTDAGFALEALGDFVGRGIWTFEALREPGVEGGPLTRITYDWRIAAEKALLRRLSFAMKPIFGRNHQWAMEQGRRSLVLELARRHATASGDGLTLAALPSPPPPTFSLDLLRRARRGR
jgi:hypothetical protein